MNTTPSNRSETRLGRPAFRKFLPIVTAVAGLAVLGGSLAQNVREAPRAQAPAVKPRPGHSAYLVDLTNKALLGGFQKEEVVLLTPKQGPGRKEIANRLRALASEGGGGFGPRLTVRGLKPARPDDRSLAFVGPQSYLKVSADGTKFIFRGNIDDPREIERASAAARLIEKGELEKLGRRFIADRLGEFVTVGPQESLTFLGARYLRNGSYNEKGRGDEVVVANIAIFGREVNGLPVVGPGSKAAVWFANDGQPVAFDVDWPVYGSVGTRQRLLARDALFERVRATTVPADSSGRARVARFECGYVDLGATKRGTDIQAGCSIHYAGREEDGTLWARVEYVPAAEKVKPDSRWPLADLIAGGRIMNTDTAEFAQYASKTKVPAVDESRDRAPRQTQP